MGKSKKGRKIGRSKRNQKNQIYITRNVRFRNKLKRVKQSCGEEFAKAWEEKFRPRSREV